MVFTNQPPQLLLGVWLLHTAAWFHPFVKDEATRLLRAARVGRHALT